MSGESAGRGDPVRRETHYHEIGGVFFLLFSILLTLSLASYNPGDYGKLGQGLPMANLIGPAGALIAHILRGFFGISSYLLGLLLANAGLMAIKNEWKDVILERTCSYCILLLTTGAVFSLMVPNQPHDGGGAVGNLLSGFLTGTMGTAGAWIVSLLFNLIALIYGGIMTVSQFRSLNIAGRFGALMRSVKKKITRHEKKVPFPSVSSFDNDRQKPGRVPWVTKKRVVVFEADKYPDVSMDAVKNDGTMEVPRIGMSPAALAGPTEDEPAAVFLREPDAVPAETISEFDSAVVIRWEEGGDEDFGGDDCAEETDEEPVPEKLHGAAVGADSRCAGVPRSLKEPELPTVRETVPADFLDRIPVHGEYIVPTTFLASSVPMDSESWQSEVRRNSMLLVNTLAEFGVESKVVNVNRGPVITLYEMQIAPGIKVNKIVGLADDIAMALAASRVRVVAPIPGKSAIGVEVPNRERELVTLGDIIKSDEYRNHHGSLKVALGKDVLGKPVIIDLKKLPHLLIAGATGSGKSVCVNSIITSLVYNYGPDYVRFILIDPKMVELQLYDGSPHLLTPVITDPMNTPLALRWALYEMERRYRLLSELNTRDIERYNQKVETEKLRMERLPFIVTIIDELADLMMIASKEIEGYITRIAQKARAVGIHLVFATQRPSVDIITGIIKANIPARIAFQVAQKTDSRTIIDQNGAEKLLGKGDMLYQSPMSSFPTRIQGANITEDEIMEVVGHLKKFGAPTFIDIEECIFEDPMSQDPEGGDDELFVEALKIVEETKKASASYLQRRLSIGYNRAARIIEQMEDLGYVGPQQGSKPREVLI